MSYEMLSYENLFSLQTVYGIPSAAGIFLAYIIPGYLLAGIHYPEVPDLDIFYLYIGKNIHSSMDNGIAFLPIFVS